MSLMIKYSNSRDTRMELGGREHIRVPWERLYTSTIKMRDPQPVLKERLGAYCIATQTIGVQRIELGSLPASARIVQGDSRRANVRFLSTLLQLPPQTKVWCVSKMKSCYHPPASLHLQSAGRQARKPAGPRPRWLRPSGVLLHPPASSSPSPAPYALLFPSRSQFLAGHRSAVTEHAARASDAPPQTTPPRLPPPLRTAAR